MKIKSHKKITSLSFNFFFLKKLGNNYMSKIFPKIYLKFYSNLTI